MYREKKNKPSKELTSGKNKALKLVSHNYYKGATFF